MKIYYGEKETAERYDIPVKTLQQKRWKREAPPYVKIGHSVRYSKEDLDNYFNSHRVVPDNER